MTKHLFKIFSLVTLLVLSLTFMSCGKKGANISFGEVPASINVNDSFTIDYSVENANGVISIVSSNPNVLQVEGQNIKGLAAGSAKLTVKVTCDDKKKTEESKEFTVKVIETRKVTITFNGNGGSVEKTSEEVTYGESFNNFPKATKENYNFVGWTLDQSGTIAVSSLEEVEEDVTVYAQYAPIIVNISYDLDGGSYIGDKTAQKGSDVALGTATKDGFEFVGWVLSKGSEEYITKIEKISGDVTVYAVFKEITYAIKYVLDGGTYEGASSATKGSTVSLGSATKDGFEFLGWSLTEGGSSYISEISNIQADTTVYAVFKANEYTVTYHLDGGSYDGAQTVTHGTTFTLGKATKSGYSFLGWSLVEGGTQYITEVTNVSGPIEVYANFGELRYEVSFFVDGVEDSKLHQSLLDGETVDLRTIEKTKEHFVFNGWTLTEGGNDFVDGVYSVHADVNFYASFEAQTFNITYELNGGILYSFQQLAEYGSELVLPTPTKNACKFLGWHLEGQTEFITSIPSVEADVKVIAEWEEFSYTITYELNGGNLSESKKETITVSEVYDLPIPTLDGFTFVGWSLNSAGNGFISQLTNVSANTTIYAIWTDGLVATPETINTVLEGAKAGDVIVLKAGEYSAITVDKSVTLKGPNAAVNPVKSHRGEEAVFTGLITITAENVTVDGIALTGKGYVYAKGSTNTLLTNIYCYETLQGSGNVNTTAPIVCIGVTNFTMSFIRYDKSTASDSNRNMIIYGYNIDGLDINNCSFTGNNGNYNDGIKIDNTAAYEDKSIAFAYGIKGNVNISHNEISGYQQYPIWLRDYQDGTYVIEDNTFSSCGITAASHAYLNAIAYSGSSNSVTMKFNYNHIISGLMAVRIDAAPETAVIEINHNIIDDLTGDYFIKNGSKATANASGNYYTGGKSSTGATITDEKSTPEEVEKYADAKSQEFNITYDLSGGNWPEAYYTTEELAEIYFEEYNKTASFKMTAATLDTAHLDSPDFAKAMIACKGNWLWLYKEIWNINGNPSGCNPETDDLTSSTAKAFYICNLNGFFNKCVHEDSNFKSVSYDYSDLALVRTICQAGPSKGTQEGPKTYKSYVANELVAPVKDGFAFGGWKTADGHVYEELPLTLTGDIELTAVWTELVDPEQVQLNNFPTAGLKLYENLQLEWVVSPSNALNKIVYFSSSNPGIFTVDENGYIYANAIGTAKLIIKLDGNSDYELALDVTVYAGDYFDIEYVTNSYCYVDEDIELRATYYNTLGKACRVTWESLTPEIATVSYGLVHALKEGQATIRAKYDDTHYIDFAVTVFGDELSEIMQFIVGNHDSNALTAYNLGIGAGNPVYYYDVVGSVNKILLNDPLKIDRRYYDKLGEGTKNNGLMNKVEFITVHYTGNMNNGADADNNCDYFNNLDYAASIHYVTGRTNLTDLTGLSRGYSEDAYYAFAGLNEKYKAWHASDSSLGETQWIATGVKVAEGDPEKPVISISSDSYFTINGKKSTYKVPKHPNGFEVTGPTFKIGDTTYQSINKLGLVSKVENGEYYMTNVWWGTQAAGDALCNIGGNHNSIGIESCVDLGSDLMHTWHVTAQLVADIMERYDLDISRVLGHHSFSGKDCPQPLLENDLQLWNYFLEMVLAENALLNVYKDAEISCEVIKGDGILRSNGLLVQDANSHIVTYKVTVTFGGKTESVILSTAVESFYCCNCQRTTPSLQNQGYEII